MFASESPFGNTNYNEILMLIKLWTWISHKVPVNDNVQFCWEAFK